MSAISLHPRQPGQVLAELLPASRVKDVALVAGGAGLTGLAAQLAITTPLTPVPFTLQTLSVLLVGAALGPARAMLSMLLYIAAGVAGVPWFAGQSHGWGGVSFGYVIGFLLAVALVGLCARRGADRSVVGTAVAMAIGNLAIYGVGTTWLGITLQVSPAEALSLGLWPFLVGDAVKLLIASLVLPGTWRLLRRFQA